MLEVGQIDFYPLFVATFFYISVFVVAEITRKQVERYISYGSLSYYFFIEAIATSQMCTCVYENAVIIRHYGLLGFFFTVASLIFIGGVMNRGAFVSPLVPIELFFKGMFPLKRLLTTIAAEAVGGYSAYQLARNLWYWSLNLSTDHAIFYETTNCKLSYKVPFILVISFEMIGCFLMRYILLRIPPSSKQYMAPAVVSAFLTCALLFIGVPGLNPTVASSRLYGCEGLNTVWFILTYWICPVVGWMFSAFTDQYRMVVLEKKIG